MRTKHFTWEEDIGLSIGDLENGLPFRKIDFSDKGKPIIKIAELNGGITASTSYTEHEYSRDVFLTKGDLVFSWSGNPDTSIDVYRYSLPDGWLNQHIFKVTANRNFVSADYLYYILKFLKPNFSMIAKNKQTTGLGHVTIADLQRMSVIVPSFECQDKISGILKAIDDKIENNNAINHNLQQQVLALYRQMFVDSPNDNRKICRADEYFDISIGKTPPRKEPEWFKTVRADNIVWVSIADMGNCGLFIGDSSEYLSPDAVKKFNVVTVPNDTVLLSFKLTVGRIAITDGQMTTNEAIAHFKTDNKAINEYLYCYLKSYNFQTLGSTSSIATAVNSKIIKAMPFVVPTDEEISTFHDFAAPIFNKIKACQHENARLVELRDSLLPKLMSGEIDVSEIEV